MTRLVALAIVNANVLARVILAVGRFVFVPGASGLRLLYIGDETANYLYIWLRRFTTVGVYGFFAVEATFLLGLPRGSYLVLLKLLGLMVLGMALVFIMQNRGAVAQAIRGRGEGTLAGLRARLADLWHIVAIVYVIAVYLVWALQVSGGFEFLARATALTIVVLVVARGVSIGVHRLVDRGFRLNKDLRERYPLLEQRANRYLPVLHRGSQIVVYVIAALLVLEVWGLGAFAWMTSDVGQSIGSRIASILFILILALAFWEIVSAVIEKFLRARSKEDGPSSARLLTLLPLIRNAVRVVLVVMVALIVLSEIGINIGPLLAGAGVVGLAVGFGAQTLVKDVITGVFILLEDSISVGEWVDLGGNTGEVEAMTIRTVRLRDLNGTVHYIPFGEIAKVTNLSKEFGYAVIDMGVAYREDVDEVIKVMEEIGRELCEDEDFGSRIMGEMEVFGVNNLGDSAVEVRVRFKTHPLKQWGVRREFLKRVKRRFDEVGIEIPFPHQTIYFGVDKEGGAPPARVLMEEAAEQSEEITSGGKHSGEGGKVERKKASDTPGDEEEIAAELGGGDEPSGRG